jgi:hypothetical protein
MWNNKKEHFLNIKHPSAPTFNSIKNYTMSRGLLRLDYIHIRGYTGKPQSQFFLVAFRKPTKRESILSMQIEASLPSSSINYVINNFKQIKISHKGYIYTRNTSGGSSYNVCMKTEWEKLTFGFYLVQSDITFCVLLVFVESANRLNMCITKICKILPILLGRI